MTISIKNIMYRQYGKRSFDFTLSLILALLSLPLIIIIACVIKFSSFKDPVFFITEMVGFKAKLFKIIKFRTMIIHEVNYNLRKDNNSKLGEISLNDPRITNIGKFLRRYKLDELPQLLNVLKGDMSLIGPRPMDYTRYINSSDFQKQRVLIRPGISGIAQTNGNIKFNWAERIEMDIWYIANVSFLLDIKIIMKTIKVVIIGEKVSKNGYKQRINDYRVDLKKSLNSAFIET